MNKKIRNPKILLLAMVIIGYVALFSFFSNTQKMGSNSLIITAIFTIPSISSLVILNILMKNTETRSRSKYEFLYLLSYILFGVVGFSLCAIELKIYGVVPFLVLWFYSLRVYKKENILKNYQ